MDLRCVSPCSPLCPTCNHPAQQHGGSPSKSPSDCWRIDVSGHLCRLTKQQVRHVVWCACSGLRMADTIFLTLPVALLQTWIGMRCSHPGCAASTRHSIYGAIALTTWLFMKSSALSIIAQSVQHMLTSLARHCSRFAGGCVQGIAVLCGLGPLRAEHTAAGGHSSVAHWRHAGLRVVGPQRPALCARPQGCAPHFSSCTLLSGSTSVMPNGVLCQCIQLTPSAAVLACRYTVLRGTNIALAWSCCRAAVVGAAPPVGDRHLLLLPHHGAGRPHRPARPVCRASHSNRALQLVCPGLLCGRPPLEAGDRLADESWFQKVRWVMCRLCGAPGSSPSLGPTCSPCCWRSAYGRAATSPPPGGR